MISGGYPISDSSTPSESSASDVAVEVDRQGDAFVHTTEYPRSLRWPWDASLEVVSHRTERYNWAMTAMQIKGMDDLKYSSVTDDCATAGEGIQQGSTSMT